jgi:hypothetical protein
VRPFGAVTRSATRAAPTPSRAGRSNAAAAGQDHDSVRPRSRVPTCPHEPTSPRACDTVMVWRFGGPLRQRHASYRHRWNYGRSAVCNGRYVWHAVYAGVACRGTLSAGITRPQRKHWSEQERSFGVFLARLTGGSPIRLSEAKDCSSNSPSRTKACLGAHGQRPSPTAAWCANGRKLCAPKTRGNITQEPTPPCRARTSRISECW